MEGRKSSKKERHTNTKNDIVISRITKVSSRTGCHKPQKIRPRGSFFGSLKTTFFGTCYSSTGGVYFFIFPKLSGVLLGGPFGGSYLGGGVVFPHFTGKNVKDDASLEIRRRSAKKEHSKS